MKFSTRPSVVLGTALCVAVSVALIRVQTAQAAAALTITPITWNVIGLDSNKPTTGPNQYPVGVRVCDTGSSPASNVTTTFVWDASNADISIGEAPQRALGTLAAGACHDVYYTAVVLQTAGAFGTSRAYHITASADSTPSATTPVPRQLYVERLVSQNRNSFLGLTGPTTVRVGTTVTYMVTTKTATNGYEQLVASTLFPPSLFDVVTTSSTYSAPAGAGNSTLYADACGWDTVPTSPTYNSCIGPAHFSGGKAGGSITTTYTLKVIAAGTAGVGTIIYDFSGSSFHYNADYSSSITSLTAVADPPPTAANDTASTTPGTLVHVPVLANDGDSDGDSLTVTGNTQPGHGSATCGPSGDCTYTPASGFSGIDSFTYTVSDGHGGTATATVTVTVATSVPAFGLDTPVPAVAVVIGMGVAAARRHRRRLT